MRKIRRSQIHDPIQSNDDCSVLNEPLRFSETRPSYVSISLQNMKLSIVSLANLLAGASAFTAPLHNQQSVGTALFARKPFITGNWKLNPSTKQEAIQLGTEIANAVTSSSPGDVALFVPFPFIEAVQRVVGDKISVGAEVRKNWVCLCIHDRSFSSLLTLFQKDDHSPNEWSIHRRNFPTNAQEYWSSVGTCWSFRTPYH